MSRSVVDSFACAVSRVWLMYCLVVFSLFAIAVTEKPLSIRDQTVFCLGLSGDVKENLRLITVHVNIWVFTSI